MLDVKVEHFFFNILCNYNILAGDLPTTNLQKLMVNRVIFKKVAAQWKIAFG